jgi:hypothetical protein
MATPPYVYPQGAALQDMSFMASGNGYTFKDGVTALAGGGQTGAVLITTAITNVTTVASAADSVQLPLAVGGQELTVINAGGNSMQVFGNQNGSDTIDGTAGSTGVAIATGKARTFYSVAAAKWRSMLSA